MEAIKEELQTLIQIHSPKEPSEYDAGTVKGLELALMLVEERLAAE